MTLIAYDGSTMAGDKRTLSIGLHYTVTKVRRLRGHLFGASGESNKCRELAAWFERGAIPGDINAELFTTCSLLVVTPEGAVMLYDSAPYPTELQTRIAAIGSGRDFAMMAMHLGKSAREAVVLTSELSVEVGNGVDVIELEGRTA